MLQETPKVQLGSIFPPFTYSNICEAPASLNIFKADFEILYVPLARFPTCMKNNITTFFWLGPELQYYLTPNNMFVPTLIIFKSEVLQLLLASLVAQTVNNPPEMQDTWVGKIPWRRAWLPTPVFLPREFHGQRSLGGSSPWGRKEFHRIERQTLSLSLPLAAPGCPG